MLRATGRDQINRFVNVCYIQLCNFVKNCHRPSTFIGARLFQAGTLFCSILLLKVNAAAISLRVRFALLTSSPLLPAPYTWKHARVFSPSSANRFAPTREQVARYLSQFLSLSLLRPSAFTHPSLTRVSLEFFPFLSIPRSAIRSTDHRPLRSSFCITSGWKCPFFRGANKQVFLTLFGCGIFGGERDRGGEEMDGSIWESTRDRNHRTNSIRQRNTLRTLVVFMTDGCNGELIPWQSAGRLYNGIIAVDK